MQISTKDWKNYIDTLRNLSKTASEKMQEYIAKNGFSDTNAVINYAYALATKYGEGAAEKACQMYDAITEIQKKALPSAVPAPTATYGETANAIYGSLLQSPSGAKLKQIPDRLVKQTAADTMLKNAIRDGAQWAWIPAGDSCVFCLTLASNGWQYASKSVLKGGHASHIHANCDCQFVIRHDNNSSVKGYDPDKLKEKYDSFEGTSSDKMNAWRREIREQNKDKINEQKRVAYASKKALLEGLGQNKNDHKILITDIAIDKVRVVDIPGYTKEELLTIQNLNKEVLQNAMKYNESNEVAMFIDKNWNLSKPILGDERGVDILKDTDMQIALRSSPLRTIVLSHNHPSLSYFSADDIGIFLQYPSIKTMGIVTNNGKTWYISKNNKYNDVEALKTYHAIIKENLNEKHDVVVDKFLNVMYSYIERNR